jgi:predicted glycogen debranching enzyme
MISLEGLTLCTKQYEVAKQILHTLSHYVHHGLLFNSFSEGETYPSYNSADASLLFFHALNRYYHYTADLDQIADFYPLLNTFINSYLNGTSGGIKVDPKDNLVFLCSEFSPLTWMDAQIFGAIFTPRNGKPVEIQAMWFNSLSLLSEWAKKLGLPHKKWEALSVSVKRSFNKKFWYQRGGYLFDLIDGPQGDDVSLRPNQIFSIALDKPVLAPALWKQVVDICQKELLTGYGLRTLSPKDKAYRPHYKGNRFDRDSAYHQGAVWAWLIGFFLDAWLKVYNDKKKARQFFKSFEGHLTEAGIGSISEVFDGSVPHIPRGCIAQAWSVAEVLRSMIKLNKSN